MSGSTFIIETERLGLRLWQDTDVIPFAIMNQKDTVMKYFTNKLTSEQSASFIEKIKKHFDEKGYGLWAVELKVTHEFIGFIGFYTPEFKAYFTPCVEIGWRLDDQFWHKGYATEGAKAVLAYGVDVLKLSEIVSFTSEINSPSIKVMKKIGLKKEGLFEHPGIKQGIKPENPLRPHVLYKLQTQ